jgi:AcrR family transcriptional regulator
MTTATAKRAANRRSRRRPRYHHGNLRAALIAATVQLIEERGVEQVSVREAAKRVGVSPAAPFRHFPTRTALLTAVAEETTRHLLDGMMNAVARHASEGPLQRFRALGTAYMRWVIDNRTQFEVVSNRSLVDFEGSKSLQRDNAAIQSLMQGLLAEAQQRGMLRQNDFAIVPLASRAISYGIARMYIDGHFAQWQVKERDAAWAFGAVFDLFLKGIAREAPSPRKVTIAPAERQRSTRK